MEKIHKIISVLILCILILHSRQKAVGISRGLSDHIDKGEFYISDVQSKVKIATYAVNESQGKEPVKPCQEYDSKTLEDVLKERSKNQIADEKHMRVPGTSLIYMKEKCPITHKAIGQNPDLEKSSHVNVNKNNIKRELPNVDILHRIREESKKGKNNNNKLGLKENNTQPPKDLMRMGLSTQDLPNIDKENIESNNSKNITAFFQKLYQNLERQKRKSGKKFVPGGLPGFYKYSRRSVPDKLPDFEIYSSKLQKMQKELSDLEKALSAPKAARKKSDDKNLTLQIRVIVDVVNNTFGQNDPPEEEQLKKRDTALSENERGGHIEAVPMPLDRDSPLQEEDDKCSNFCRLEDIKE